MKSDLEYLRKNLTKINEKIILYAIKRLHLIRQIASLKEEKGVALLCPHIEDELLTYIEKIEKNEHLEGLITPLFQSLLDTSHTYQEHLITPTAIPYFLIFDDFFKPFEKYLEVKGLNKREEKSVVHVIKNDATVKGPFIQLTPSPIPSSNPFRYSYIKIHSDDTKVIKELSLFFRLLGAYCDESAHLE